MIEIKANKSILIDGEPLNSTEISMGDFLISSLNCPITIDENLILSDLIHILYDIKDFINLYCCEEYEVGRALITSGRLLDAKDYLSVFKSVEVTTSNILKINTQCSLDSFNDIGTTQNVGNLKVKLIKKMLDNDENINKNTEIECDFTLLDIIEVIYEDFVYSLKKDNLLF
jgi:hypothetical protein